MDLNEALRRHGIDIPDLEVVLHQGLDIAPGDTVFLAGSLVEGLGNSRSDVDVFVVSEETMRSPREPLILNVGRLTIDVEIRTRGAVESLIEHLRRSVDGADVAASRTLARPEVEFLHRLATGAPLQNGDELRNWQDAVQDRLPRLLVRRALVLADGYHVDCVGAAEDGDWESAAWMAQQVADAGADAYLGASRFTSEAPKWRLRRLRSITDTGWSLSVPGSDPERTVADDYAAATLCKDGSVAGLRAQAHAAVRLANRLMPWAVSTAEGEPMRATLQADQSPLAPVTGSSPAPLLRLDVAIRCRGSGQYAIGALEEDGLVVNDLAVDVLCRFDGQRSHADVVAQLEARWGASEEVLSSAVGDFECLAQSRELAAPSEHIAAAA